MRYLYAVLYHSFPRSLHEDKILKIQQQFSKNKLKKSTDKQNVKQEHVK